MEVDYMITKQPHAKASKTRTKWCYYELNNLNDVDYYSTEQEKTLNKISQAKKTVEVEMFFDYAMEYSRLFNENNDSYMMYVDRLDSKSSKELTLIKKTTFEKGAVYKNFTGLQMDTLRVSFKKVNRIEF